MLFGVKFLLKSAMLAVILTSGMALGQSAGPTPGVGQVSPPPAPAGVDASVKPVSDKQKALAEQTDKLLTMAKALKAEVDRTNKDVLSLKVIRTAEEIEQFTRRMKDRAKK